MDIKNLIDDILDDIRVEAAEEFDRNFERKGFFENGTWAHAQYPNHKGSLMMRSGKLRRSIKAEKKDDSVIISSSEPYAEIHNEGGEITVTANMKKYFWAKYYELSGKVKTTKSGKASKSKSSQRANAQAEYYKRLALMKEGSVIAIQQRQFVGMHPDLERALETIALENMERFFKEYFNDISESLK